MSFFTKSSGLMITMYTNKCKDTFTNVHNMLYDELKDSNKSEYGLIYSDTNTDMELVKTLNNIHPNMLIFYTAPMSKTSSLDDKKLCCQRLEGLSFVPQYVKDIHKCIDISGDELLYVKHRSKSGSTDVHIVSKDEIIANKDKYTPDSYVIQRNVSNPVLIQDKRYKLRIYLLLHNKQIYIHQSFFGLLASKIYDPLDTTHQNLIDMNIIHQTPETKWLLPHDISGNEEIFKNILVVSSKIKDIFRTEIDSISNNEYCILGADYVLNDQKQPFLIEINHRSNYKHPTKINKSVDVPILFDAYKVMISGTNNNTNYILI